MPPGCYCLSKGGCGLVYQEAHHQDGRTQIPAVMFLVV
jgi:hypothetical protein